MARSLIELLDATGSIHGQWRTDSHSALIENTLPIVRGSAKDVKDLLFKVDLLPNLESASALGLSSVAYDVLPEENKLVVYADLFVPEFRAAERFFYEQVVPAAIRSNPSREVLEMRSKVYSERNQYFARDFAIINGKPNDRKHWEEKFITLFNDFLEQQYETAKKAVEDIHKELSTDPLFISLSGAYEQMTCALRGASKTDNPEHRKYLSELPTLTLLKRFE